MTKIQLFSDLHADWGPPRPVMIGDDVNLVVVPGDVAEGAVNSFAILRRIVPASFPIVFTMGNHEYYKRFFSEELARARSAAVDFGIVLLENDVAYLPADDRGGLIRFVGATGWTDYRLFGEDGRLAAMAAAREQMNDHKRIGWRRLPWERFRPQEAAALHERSKRFIAETISVPHAGPTIVVTHTAPSLLSVPERWKRDPLTAAYASTIGHDLLEAAVGLDPPNGPRVDFWFHGHVHEPADYFIGNTRVKTRVMANPNGYGNEVAGFNPQLTIEV